MRHKIYLALDEIDKTLSQYSRATLESFEENFPCEHPNPFMVGQAFLTYSKNGEEWQYIYHVQISSVENFWKRWDRFTNLAAFT